MPKLTRVSENTLEFNQAFIQDMLQQSAGNAQHLALAQRALHDILAHDLTDRQREILVMHYYEGRRLTEIGRILGLDKSTISRTLRRARQRIRKHLRFYFDYTNFRLSEE